MSLRNAGLMFLVVLALAAFAAACAAPAPEGECLEPGEDGTMVPVPCPDNGEATPTPPPGNDVPAGQAVFVQSGCGGCHTIAGVSSGGAGPELTQVGAIAGDRVAGLSAEEYLHQAIVSPEDYVVEGFPAGMMPGDYEQRLSEEQINQLVEYLASLQ